MIITFKCYFDGDPTNTTFHRREMEIAEIPKWIEAYSYTHPTCTSISAKVRFESAESNKEDYENDC